MADVAIIGAGAVGLGLAALLSLSGHAVRLHARQAPAGPLAGFDLTAQDRIAWSGQVQASSTIGAVVEDAAFVILCVPGTAQKAMIDAMLPFLRSGQTLIISAQYSLSALYASKCLAERAVTGVDIIALASTIVTGRRLSPHSVRVRTVRDNLRLAAFAAGDETALIDRLRTLLGKNVRPVSMLDIALGNLNPVAHVPNALCNLTRIETGEEWSNWGQMTGTVCALIAALDAERCTLARAYGVEPVSFAQHLHNSFGTPMGPIDQMCAHIAAANGKLNGPHTLDTRYVTEDVPYGLVPLVALGQRQGMDMPAHKAFITLLSLAYARPFDEENDILPALDLMDLSSTALQDVLRSGWSAAPMQSGTKTMATGIS